MSKPTRILVTTKGETGYLRTEIGLDLRTRYSAVLDPAQADTFTSPADVERFALLAARRFDTAEIESPEEA